MKRGHEESILLPVASQQSPLTSRLGACEVCAARDARYTCPKCEVKTCSLPCVRIHKAELDCNGIRDRTKYIPLNKMTKMDFMSDYYFLEECTRYVEDRKTDQMKHFTRYNKSLPNHLFRLRNAATERGTTLRFLLSNFSRHKENSTYVERKRNHIYWYVQWVFVNAGGEGGLKYTDKKCSEDKTLRELLDKYLNPLADGSGVPLLKELEYYQSAGVNGVKVLLKAEGIKRCQNRFYPLDVDKTLKENLAGKTIVEFPCIYLSYDKNVEGLDLIDSDEDVETESKAHRESLEALRRNLDKNKNNNTKSTSNEEDRTKKREERLKQRQELEKNSSNFLFTDDKLWNMFSSSDTDGNATEEETTEATGK